MKKDTHGVFICITPNWNFPLKNTAPTPPPPAVRGKLPHLGKTTGTGEQTILNHHSVCFLDLEPCFSETQFRAVSYKLKRRQKNYWSSSHICICMSSSPRFHPDIIMLHMGKPALIETGASALGELAAPGGQESSVLVRKLSNAGGSAKSAQGRGHRGKAQLHGHKISPSSLVEHGQSKARGEAGRTEESRELKIQGRIHCPGPSTVC